MNGVMNILELMITYHSVPGRGHQFLVPVTLYICYTMFMYMLGKYSNVWIYPFLEGLCWSKRMIFAVIGGIKMSFNYMVCVYLNKLFWPQNRILRYQQIMG